jgi:bifunctional non-homologous end joining protein LigD
VDTAAYLYVDSLPGLIALVQLGVLELHTWGSRKENIERPDRLIFDLDPDPSVPWTRLKEAAQLLRSRLASLNLTAFVKTTGGKGLHVVVPIKPKTDWDFAKNFSKSVAESIVRDAPQEYIHYVQSETSRQNFHRLSAQCKNRQRGLRLLHSRAAGRSGINAPSLGRTSR